MDEQGVKLKSRITSFTAPRRCIYDNYYQRCMNCHTHYMPKPHLNTVARATKVNICNGEMKMKLSDIVFEDEAFKACVLASKALDSKDLVELICRKQKIESIAGIEHLTDLKRLDLTKNKLTEANLSHNSKLEEVCLGNNRIEKLDVSTCKELTHLEVFMNDLEALDLSYNPKLENIYANQNEFEELDVSKNAELEDLRVDSNNLTTINISANTKLSRLDIGNNPLTSQLDLPPKSNLKLNQ